MNSNQQKSTKQLEESSLVQKSTKQLDKSSLVQESTKQLEELSLKDNRLTKNLVMGSFLATLIAMTPLLFTFYESVPDTPIWDTFLFKYYSGAYNSAQYAMWVLTGKIIPLYLLFIWFFTCRHWWYHALLVPIILYAFQIVKVISVDNNPIDEFQLLYLLPIMALVVPSIYLIRARIFNKINLATKSMQELEDEFKASPKGVWSRVKQYF